MGLTHTHRPLKNRPDFHIGVREWFLAHESWEPLRRADERAQRPTHLDPDEGVQHRPEPEERPMLLEFLAERGKLAGDIHGQFSMDPLNMCSH